MLLTGIALAGSYAAQRSGVASAQSHAPSIPHNPYSLADSCTVTLQVRDVHIAGSNPYTVTGRLTAGCGASDATWDMLQGQQRVSGWFFYSGTMSQASFYPGIDPLGGFRASPTGAYDASFNTLPQNTDQFYVKVDSRISVSGYRSGNVVYVRARVTRFSPNANYFGGWVNSAGRNVVFYQNRGGWRRVGARGTGTSGYTSYLPIYSPAHRLIRATVSATPSIWDRTSAPVSR